MNKYWTLIITINGLQRMWLSNEQLISLMKNEYIGIIKVYRSANEQEAILTSDDKIVWQDVPTVEFKEQS